MILADIKSKYKDRLAAVYPLQEIESIFSLAVNSVLKYSKIDLHLNIGAEIPPQKESSLLDILDRLACSEPIQYILGETEFYDLVLKTDKRALIPRPETELLVDIILKDDRQTNFYTIIDLCTGSGCIAVTLARNLANSRVSAMELSKDALELAKENALLNKAEINFIRDDLLNPVHHYEKFDLIVSNPPYVRESEKSRMHNNVLNFEPRQALFVGDNDPLIFYSAIADFGNKYLNPQGLIYAEINEELGAETQKVFLHKGFGKSKILKDLNNKDRYICAER